MWSFLRILGVTVGVKCWDGARCQPGSVRYYCGYIGDVARMELNGSWNGSRV